MFDLISRIVYALMISVLIGFSFRQSWKKEHLSPSEKTDEDVDATILWSSEFFAFLIMLLPAVYVISSGFKDGILHFGYIEGNVLIVFSIWFAVMMILLPILRKHISARACALLWTAPMFIYWQFTAIIDYQYIPVAQIYIPEKILHFLIYAWAIGFVLIFTVRLIMHLIFCWKIHSAAYPVFDDVTRDIFHQLQNELCYHNQVKLIRSSAASGPFSMGMLFWTKCLVLPEKSYTEEELRMVLSHEMHHLQRSDVETKFFLVFITSFCWINPLVWIGARKAAQDLELSCDEIVTEHMSDEERKKYAMLLLNSSAPSTGFTTCLSAAAGTLRYRMKNVVDIRKKSLGILWFSAGLFLCVLGYGAIGITTEKGSFTELLMESEGSDPEINSISTWSDESIEGFLESLNDNPDMEAISAELDQIQLQKLDNYCDYESSNSENGISFDLDTETTLYMVYIYRDLVVVEPMNNDAAEYYKVVSDVDWEALTEAFSKEAGSPEK